MQTGAYCELFIKDGRYKYSCDFDLVTSWQEFEIIGNTFIQYDRVDGLDTTYITKSIFTLVENDTLILKHIQKNNTYLFIRLKEIPNNLDNNFTLIKETKQRAIDAKCPDKRTPEEIREDSILFSFDLRF